MKHSSHSSSFALALLLGSLTLVGCGGSLNFPDSVASSQAAGPPINGSVYGGHAPIVGSHVYLLQPSTSAYGGVATSLLGNNGATSANGYTLTPNVNDPNVPTTTPVPEYVTTDSSGDFSLTGAYTCTVDQPVYIYAYGGNIGNTTTTTTTPVTVNGLTALGSQITGAYIYTFYFTKPVATPLVAGDTVTLSNLQGGGGATDWQKLDTSYVGSPANSPPFETVLSATPTSFKIADPRNLGVSGPMISGTVKYTYTATTIHPPTQNTSIVQLATLGNCPTSGNFSTTGNGALSFVYMNEVSTVAAAYTFQPFTLAANNDAWDIGTRGTTQSLLGIANAANTAAQLYDIQGNGQTSTSNDGEGHLANATTPVGNGTVPQATIDTLANIVAACVDSTPPTGGGASAACTTLFNIATDNGNTIAAGDIPPVDTATAAINIARYPAGNHSDGTGGVDATYARDLFAIPGTIVPYVPDLAAAPNDFTISISYTGGGIGHTGGQSPHAVAVDGSGNIYTLNYTLSQLSIFSPLGVPLSATGFTGNGLNGPASVAIDSTSANVWVPDYSTGYLSRFTTAGAAAGTFSVGETKLQDAEIDGSGNIWVTANTANALVKLNNSGTVLTTITTGLIYPFSLVIEAGPAGNVWVADETQADASAYTNAGLVYGSSPFTAGGIDDPTGNAVDASGNIWFGNHNGTVTAFTSAGVALTGSPFATGSTNHSDGIAIDGLGNVWVSNSSGETVYKLTNAGAEITGPTGYTAKPATEADGIAIDGSGNVWYDSYNAAVLYELVGAASPVVTPLSYAVENSELGTQP